MATITIKPGDNLSTLAQKYGTTVAELAKINNIANPNMIRAGASLSIPDIAGTLGTGTATPPPSVGSSLTPKAPISQPNAPINVVQTPEKTLPNVSPSHLSIFQTMMKQAVNEGVQKARATAQNFFPEASKMSGGTFADVINMVNQSSTQGVADIYKSTIDLLNTQQATAENHLKILIESKALAQMDDKTLIKLANTSGMDYDYLSGLKNQQIEENKKPKSFETTETGGRQIRYGFDSAGNIVSKQDLGEVKKPNTPLPSSYVEWQLAGGLKGTGHSYADILMGNNGDTIENIGDAIISGNQPPITTGLYKNTAGVKSYLQEKGFNQSKALLQYNAALKTVAALNSSQMVRFRGLAESVVNTIDEVKNLAKEVKNSGVVPLNQLKLQAYIKTAGNTEAGQLATRYMNATNTLKEEFANLANGGYAPTEAAWKLANDQINGNYGVDQLTSSLTEVQRLINYRVSALTDLEPLTPGMGTQNAYMQGTVNNNQKPLSDLDFKF